MSSPNAPSHPSRRGGGPKDPMARGFLEGRGAEALAALNAQFMAEQASLRLQFQCTDCQHAIPGEVIGCSMEYPNAELLAVQDTGVVLTATGQTWFCKHFEAL